MSDADLKWYSAPSLCHIKNGLSYFLNTNFIFSWRRTLSEFWGKTVSLSHSVSTSTSPKMFWSFNMKGKTREREIFFWDYEENQTCTNFPKFRIKENIVCKRSGYIALSVWNVLYKQENELVKHHRIWDICITKQIFKY